MSSLSWAGQVLENDPSFTRFDCVKCGDPCWADKTDKDVQAMMCGKCAQTSFASAVDPEG